MFKNILDFFYRKINYLWGFLNFSLSFYIVLSILSYNQNDVSYNKSTSAQVKNLLGRFGSMIADPLLQLLGPSVIFYSVFLVFWGINFFRNEKIKFFPVKIAFSIFSLIILSFFFNMIPSMEWWPFNYFGGIIGETIHKKLAFSLSNLCVIQFILLILLIFLSCFSLSVSFKDFKSFLYSFFDIFLKIPKIFSYKTDKNILLNEDTEEEFEEKPEIVKTEENEQLETKSNEKFTIIPRKEEKKSFFAKPAQAVRKESFVLPSSSLLNYHNEKKKKQCSETELQQNANLLIKVLKDFGVRGEIMDIYPGPVVTLYEFKPSAGTKSSRVIGLADDIARSMSSISARISVIPGKDALGIELPNLNREMVYLRELLESAQYKNTNYSLPIILGKDISGEEKIVELAKMPHLLVAGTTGSGKSVAINTMILSLLFHHSPSECKFIMIDPKMLELSVYDDIPHLLTPVVTDPTKAVTALKWAVKEMENRYKLMSNLSVRNITSYNERLDEALAKKEVIEKSVQTGYDVETGKPIYEKIPINMEKLPLIVVIVDEMADLMLVAGKEIESSIQRLAQMARAAGIHIIMATQRPSVDVITGVIKANFPTRISFQVTSKIDSRTILSEQGAEQLLGMGDMLYMSGGNKVIRVHGPFVSDQEVEKVVSYLKSQGLPQYIEDITAEEDDGLEENNGENQENDPYFQAVSIVKREGKASTSYIQRCLSIGYNRAALIIERMEKEGIVSKADHVGRRVVLIRD